MGTYSLDPNVNKAKAIKELELMAKKIKKRMSAFEKMGDPLQSAGFVQLSCEYRQIKESIIRIIQM